MATNRWTSDFNRNVVAVAIVVTTSTAFVLGYGISVLNQLYFIVWDFYAVTYERRRDGRPLSEAAVGVLWSLTCAIHMISGIFAAVLCGYLADRIGRIRTVLVGHAFTVVGIVLGSISLAAAAPELLIVSRVFIGAPIGFALVLTPIILTEISPKSIRGILNGVSQLVNAFAVVVSAVLGLPQVLGRADVWPYLYVLGIVPVLLTAAVLPFVPETPRHLLLSRRRQKDKSGKVVCVFSAERVPSQATYDVDDDDGDHDNLTEVRGSLQFYRRNDDVEEELTNMVHLELKDDADGKQFTARDMFIDKKLRRPLVVACVLQVYVHSILFCIYTV